MSFARTTPFPSGSHSAAVSTNVSQHTREISQRPKIVSVTRKMQELADRKVQIEKEFAEIKAWVITKLARGVTDEERAEVLSVARQQKLPLRTELTEIERQLKRMRQDRHVATVEENQSMYAKLLEIEAKLDRLLAAAGMFK